MTGEATGEGWCSCLYRGEVMHERLRPRRHRFSYRVFNLFLDLDELPRLHRSLRLFSHDRFNLLSFHERDHGPGEGRSLRPWIEGELSRAGIDLEGGPIRLLCYPRILGYVFNPLSLWFCHDRQGRLRALLYEVHNTFGERHGYLFPFPAEGAGEAIAQGCDKSFHVSPFLPMDCAYRFRLKPPGERLSVTINQDALEYGGPEPVLVATLRGQRQELSDRTLLGCFFRYPLMTLKVIAAIHWEALRLWAKGATFHSKPPREGMTVEIIRPASSEVGPLGLAAE